MQFAMTAYMQPIWPHISFLSSATSHKIQEPS